MTFISRPVPIGFAHRGARRECQDNTLKSFARALELGAQALETDAWLSADGVAVLDHDGQVRQGLRRRPLRTIPRAALPRHIPSLHNLYERCEAAFELSVDIKDPAVVAPLVEVARGAGATSRLWLCSSDPDALKRWRGLDDDAHLVHSTTLRSVTGHHVPHRDLPADAAAGMLAVHARGLRAAGVEAVNLHQQSWTAAGVRAVQGEGTAAFAWDAQTLTALRHLMGLGVDAVYSDDVALMVTVIAEAATA